MRALELIKTFLSTLSKYVDLNNHQYMSNILRQQILNAMLFVVKHYHFSSIACSQAILVLDFLKSTLQVEDFQLLKAFVQENLEEDTAMIEFASGRKTTNTNLGPILKMAFELKKLTMGSTQHEKEDPEGQDSEEEEKAPLIGDDHQWAEFCTETLGEYENKWTKKLEDYGIDKEDLKAIVKSKKKDQAKLFDDSNSESSIINVLSNVQLKKEQIKERNKNLLKKKEDELNACSQEEEKKQENGFHDYQFWKVPEYFTIEDLLSQQ